MKGRIRLIEGITLVNTYTDKIYYTLECEFDVHSTHNNLIQVHDFKGHKLLIPMTNIRSIEVTEEK